MHEAFHDHLPGERARDSAALTARKERHGEERARGGGSQKWCERQVSNANPVAFGAESNHVAARHGHALLTEEYHRGEHHDRRVNEESDSQRHGRVDGVEP